MKLLRDLKGRDFETVYQAEVENFANAKAGVPGDDVEAALLLKDMLARLYAGEIHAAPLDEDSRFADLKFRENKQ